MKYLRGTQEECQELASRMDSFYGYPNLGNKTTTTSEIEKIPGTSEYCVFVPSDFVSKLTTDESNKTSNERPNELEYNE